jgi:hypothetical protein
MLSAIVLAAAITTSGPGGWGYAHWGMNQTELEAASHGNARRDLQYSYVRDDDEHVYQMGNVQVEPTFYFKNGHLNEIEFNAVSSCDDIKRYLKSTYGRGVLDAGNPAFHIIKWIDRKNEVRVTLEFMPGAGDTCHFSLSPVSAGENTRDDQEAP